jgi:hypothetical protein
MTSENTKKDLIASCGLVCSECGMFSRGRCDGCGAEKSCFKGCPVKKCSTEKKCATCADCHDFSDLRACKKLNNFISKVFGFIFRKDRIGQLIRIREIGPDAFLAERKKSQK